MYHAFEKVEDSHNAIHGRLDIKEYVNTPLRPKDIRDAVERENAEAFRRYLQVEMCYMRDRGFLAKEELHLAYVEDPDGERYEEDSDVEMDGV